MINSDQSDMALQAILIVAKETDTGLPEELILKAYSIQRRHQFDREGERDVSLQETQRLVEEYVGAVGGST